MNIVERNRTYAILLIALLVILAGLMALYYSLTRPPQSVEGANLEGYSHVYSIYYATPGDRLYRPTEVAVDSSGNLYVVDTFKHRVLIYDKRGNFIGKFGKKGKNPGEFEFPSAITTDAEGRIYVLSNKQNRVQIFNRQKKLVWIIDIKSPLAATVKAGKLYITTDRGVMVGDLKGNLLFSFGIKGRGKGQFNRPTGIAVDDKGNIYVADSMNYRLSAYNKEGKHLWDVGSPVNPQKAIQSRERKFGLPTSLTLADDGLLYLMDAFNGEIYMFDTNGKQVGVVGEWGKEDGEFYYPAGIAYMGNELFAVADKFNDRIEVIRIPSPKTPTIVRASRYVPWFLALLLLPLLALIRRRRLILVADQAFIDKAISEGKLEALMSSARRLYVAPNVYETYKDKSVDGVKLGKSLRPVSSKPERKERLASSYDASDEVAEILAGDYGRGRVTILSADDALRKIAELEGRVTISFDEWKGTLSS